MVEHNQHSTVSVENGPGYVTALIEKRLTDKRGPLRRCLVGNWRLVDGSLRECEEGHYEFDVQRWHRGRLSVRFCSQTWFVSPLGLSHGWPDPSDRLVGVAADVKTASQLCERLQTIEQICGLCVEHGTFRVRLPLATYANCASSSRRLFRVTCSPSEVLAHEAELEISGFEQPWRVLARLDCQRLRILRIGPKPSRVFWRWCARRWGVS
jgi:hypothetical protein